MNFICTMRIAIVDGLLTLFYDGSELYDEDLYYEWIEEKRRKKGDEQNMQVSPACRDFIYERWSWQQVIVLDGVKEIPTRTFLSCKNIKRVIFSDSVICIKSCAFMYCRSLTYIKWSINLKIIRESAFASCNLYSVFLPRSCKELRSRAFVKNENFLERKI